VRLSVNALIAFQVASYGWRPRRRIFSGNDMTSDLGNAVRGTLGYLASDQWHQGDREQSLSGWGRLAFPALHSV
jgi:hypothetical protein